MGQVPALSQLLITPKPLCVEHFAKICCLVLSLYLQDAARFRSLPQKLSK